MIYFELIFIVTTMVWRESNLILLHMEYQLSQHYLLKRLFFPKELFWYSYWKSNMKAYFWTLNSNPLICVYNLMYVPQRLDYYCFTVCFKNKKCKSSNLSSFSRLFWPFWVPFYSLFIVYIMKVCQILFLQLVRWLCGFVLYSASMAYYTVICWANFPGINPTWWWYIILFIYYLIWFASILMILWSSCTCFLIRQSISNKLNSEHNKN